MIPNLGDLEGNNYCRNPDGDTAPWCIAPNGEFDYCDIPLCSDVSGGFNSVPVDPVEASLPTPAQVNRCKADQFQCRVGECVLSAYVCDGHRDCSNGADESSCNRRELDKFDKLGRSRLTVPYVERWLHTSTEACAQHCTVPTFQRNSLVKCMYTSDVFHLQSAVDFTCKSFNYHAAKRLCTLSESNVGMSGSLAEDSQWDYYELSSEALRCTTDSKCPSGKCLKQEMFCDGKDDCGDG